MALAGLLCRKKKDSVFLVIVHFGRSRGIELILISWTKERQMGVDKLGVCPLQKWEVIGNGC
jgi:hypothetical protein